MRRLILTIAAVFFLPTVTLGAEYDRDDWEHWEDFDRDCLNTRHELLKGQSLVDVTYTSDSGCYVATGAWQGPFTGLVFTQANQIDVDHIIPLAYAHEHGGAQWSALLKKVFANDPENLLVVERGENRSKEADGSSQYMPPDEGYHCEYTRRWLHLVCKYEIDIPDVDRRLIEDTISECRR